MTEFNYSTNKSNETDHNHINASDLKSVPEILTQLRFALVYYTDLKPEQVIISKEYDFGKYYTLSIKTATPNYIYLILNPDDIKPVSETTTVWIYNAVQKYIKQIYDKVHPIALNLRSETDDIMEYQHKQMHEILSADFKADERSMKRWQEICNYLYLITEMRKFQQNCPITIADIGMKPFDNTLEAKRMINTINVKKFKIQNTISNFSFSTGEPLTPLKRQRLHELSDFLDTMDYYLYSVFASVIMMMYPFCDQYTVINHREVSNHRSYIDLMLLVMLKIKGEPIY